MDGDEQVAVPRTSESSRRDQDSRSPAMQEELRDAIASIWESMRRNGFWDGAVSSQRKRMHAVAALAIDAGVLPERLLTIVKESWRALPEVTWATHRYLADERRDQIITLCIEEYYARNTGNGDGAASILRT
jgi:hypothetical protein